MSYQKFVIISYLRSGTHLLRTALESHPHIVCQTEVFNSDNPNLPYSLSLPSQQVLDDWVYNKIPTQTSHVGFVLQAYHPFSLKAFPGIKANARWNDIWTILKEIPDLKVIHLRRENLLRRHLSHVRARDSQQWHNWDARQLQHISLLEAPPNAHIDQYKKPSTSLTLDENRLHQDFTEVNEWHQRAKLHFGEHHTCDVLYESLQHNFQNECARVLKFLGASPYTLSEGVRKLENRPLSECITNYHTLKNTFSGSPWQHYFED
ncbi:sulfotransferase [Pseudoalteromonas sp. MMG013]|uniref:sulfotransferase n=1 Tax=Pseudoalteromonas sp. MMG013 TaxID=2822687 RepID=UPI001B363A2D|nr:sulfotransferase [Pseudoalteromonas sp. MMG013]MBQ4863051.1 sulfotransferase [Pseudoalteromonas sp. MMG013]